MSRLDVTPAGQKKPSAGQDCQPPSPKAESLADLEAMWAYFKRQLEARL